MLGSYLARMGVTLVRSGTGGAVAPLDEARLALRVWPTDLDIYGHVNNGRFLTLMDMGRLDYAVRSGMGRIALRRGWRPVVGAAVVRFRRELAPFAAFDLVTRVVTWDERAMYLEHRLERGGELSARAFLRIVTKRQGQTVAPSEMFAAVGIEGPPPELPAGPTADLVRSLSAF